MVTIKKVGKKPPAKTMIYGQPGIGKTSFGFSAPAPVGIITEMGIAGLEGVEYIDLSGDDATWQKVLDAIEHLATTKHEFKSLIVDVIDGVSKLCEEFICQTEYNGQWTAKKGVDAFIPFAAGYTRTAIELRKLTLYLDRLIQNKGMQVILLSHVEVHNIKNATGADYGKFAGGMDKREWQVFHKWCDVIGYAHHEQRVYGDKEGKGGKEKIEKERVVTFLGSGGADCKSRAGFTLPDSMPLDYKLFSKELYGTGKKGKE